jgi:hypothetical protein
LVVGDEARRGRASKQRGRKERDLQHEEENADIESKRKGKLEIGERRKESETPFDSTDPAAQLAHTNQQRQQPHQAQPLHTSTPPGLEVQPAKMSIIHQVTTESLTDNWRTINIDILDPESSSNFDIATLHPAFAPVSEVLTPLPSPSNTPLTTFTHSPRSAQ